jgi:hypothetical protein
MAWEYRVLTTVNEVSEVDLNQLGSEGWELVGMTSYTEATEDEAGGVSLLPGDLIIMCVFKRQLVTG